MLALLTLLGFGLRLFYLGQPMRYDEAYSYLFFVHVPLASTLSDYSLPNQHILNSLLMRMCEGLFGNAPWALRLPAFAFGVALIPATYFCLRRLLGADASLLAAALTASSAPLVVYSTNARGYSLIVLLFLVAIAASVRVQESRGRSGWLWLVVAAVIGLYTIPIMLYAIGGVFIWHAIQAHRRQRRESRSDALRPLLRCGLYVVVITGILYLPVLIRMGPGPLIANDWVSARTPSDFFVELPAAMRDLWRSWHGGLPAPIVVALVVGAATYALWRRARREHASLIASIVIWCVVLLFVTMRPPFARVWLFLLPLYFGIAAAGLVALLSRTSVRRQHLLVAAAALLVSLWSAFSVLESNVVLETEGPLFPDAKDVVSYLAKEAKPGDGIYVRTPADAPVWYYTWRQGLPDAMLRLKYNAPRRILVVVNETERQTIEELLRVTPLGRPGYGAPTLRRQLNAARVYEILRTK